MIIFQSKKNMYKPHFPHYVDTHCEKCDTKFYLGVNQEVWKWLAVLLVVLATTVAILSSMR